MPTGTVGSTSNMLSQVGSAVGVGWCDFPGKMRKAWKDLFFFESWQSGNQIIMVAVRDQSDEKYILGFGGRSAGKHHSQVS